MIKLSKDHFVGIYLVTSELNFEIDVHSAPILLGSIAPTTAIAYAASKRKAKARSGVRSVDSGDDDDDDLPSDEDMGMPDDYSDHSTDD